MTLILSVQCDDYTILLADRRTSRDGDVVEDDYTKCGVVYCVDGTFAFGFTGIASLERTQFLTIKWIRESIGKIAQPKQTHQELIQSFTAYLNDNFFKIALVGQSRLAILFSGYFYDDREIYGRSICISNFGNCLDFKTTNEASSRFEEYVYTQGQSIDDDRYIDVTPIGNWRPLTKKDTDSIADIVLIKKGRRAVVGRCIDIMRRCAEQPESKNNIGQQINEIFIPHDPRESPIGKYHSGKNTNFAFFPTLISVAGDSPIVQPGMIFKATPKMTEDQSWIVPKVKMNQPCPCGKGKRYKDCHGNPRASKILTIKIESPRLKRRQGE